MIIIITVNNDNNNNNNNNTAQYKGEGRLMSVYFSVFQYILLILSVQIMTAVLSSFLLWRIHSHKRTPETHPSSVWFRMTRCFIGRKTDQDR